MGPRGHGNAEGNGRALPGLDGTMVDGARRGESEAITALYRAVHPRVVRYLRGLEPRHADDIAADVWVAVARGLATFDGGPEAFGSWVFSIARRRLADHRRTAARRVTDTVDPSDFRDRTSNAPGPEDELDRSEGQRAVDRIVALLPPEQAEVVLLRVLGELDAETVGRIVGRSANWVRVTQHRALGRLADALRGESSRDV